MELQIADNVSITMNGVTYTGNNIVVDGGKVIIDGELQEQKLSHKVHVVVNGDVLSLSNGSGSVTAQNVGTIKTGSGNISCNDVAGSVKTGSGDVRCVDIKGAVRTGSGDIIYGSTL